MAGYISIADGIGCSMGSHHFRSVMMLAREFFLPSEKDIVENLYEYYDATGDCLITLRGSDKRALNAFYRALSSAAENARVEGEEIHFGIVDEILEKLKNDPRFEE